MKVNKLILTIMVLVSFLLMACGKPQVGAGFPEENVLETEDNFLQESPKGGLPTPFVGDTLGDYLNDPYMRERDRVNYDTISPEEYRIRSTIEFSRINESRAGNVDEDIINGIKKYGIDNYYAINDFPVFFDVADMKTVLRNEEFLSDFHKNTGVTFQSNSYSLPGKISIENFSATLVELDGVPHFQLYGMQTTDDGNYYAMVWAVFSVPGGPDANEIAQFYADIDGLEVLSDEGPTSTVYHFSSDDGCAFLEKFGIETNDPATIYIWEQDGVIGVIILPGEHKPENLDLCVLEKHEL